VPSPISASSHKRSTNVTRRWRVPFLCTYDHCSVCAQHVHIAANTDEPPRTRVVLWCATTALPRTAVLFASSLKLAHPHSLPTIIFESALLITPQ
jgi:hypothetical protein